MQDSLLIRLLPAFRAEHGVDYDRGNRFEADARARGVERCHFRRVGLEVAGHREHRAESLLRGDLERLRAHPRAVHPVDEVAAGLRPDLELRDLVVLAVEGEPGLGETPPDDLQALPEPGTRLAHRDPEAV